MNPLFLFNVVLHSMAVLPAIEGDLKAILGANWNQGVVQDFVQGVEMAAKLVADVASEKAATAAPAVTLGA